MHFGSVSVTRHTAMQAMQDRHTGCGGSGSSGRRCGMLWVAMAMAVVLVVVVVVVAVVVREVM